MDVVKFGNHVKEYEIEDLGIFNLKPPYMNTKDKASEIFQSIMDIFEKNKDKVKEELKGESEVDIQDVQKMFSTMEETKEIEKEIRVLQVKFLKTVLDGDVKKLTVDNLRMDFYLTVFSDFFSLYRW